jgi:hypothetical protein
MLPLRLNAFCLLADLLAMLSLTGGAPVPKQRPPEGLTVDAMVGVYDYSWGGFPDGVLTLNKDGSYVGIHVPGSDQIYAGHWRCTPTSVVIEEWSYSAVTGELRGGPAIYVFEFGAGAKLPELVGKSNGTVHVKLTRAKEGR